MNLYNNKLYMEDVHYVANLDLPWERLRNKKIILSGATGMIGSFFVDVIMEKNKTGLGCMVYALSRNTEKAKERFYKYIEDKYLSFIPYDVNYPLSYQDFGTINYILHLASNTHPFQYATDPIGTITTNIIGLQNMLDFAVAHKAERFVFASSNEIYGENRGDVEFFDENYCGYINSNTMRAGYPESKRCGEALCQAYIFQKKIDVVIPRITRTYGPTMLMSDTKAISQFIKKGLLKEDIVLKSEGTQYYSYQYVADTISGILYILLLGETGRAYNIADEQSDIMLKDLANIVAEISGKNVVLEIPDEVEKAGYSTATKARLKGDLLKNIGWSPQYSIQKGIARTLKILKEIN